MLHTCLLPACMEVAIWLMLATTFNRSMLTIWRLKVVHNPHRYPIARNECCLLYACHICCAELSHKAKCNRCEGSNIVHQLKCICLTCTSYAMTKGKSIRPLFLWFPCRLAAWLPLPRTKSFRRSHLGRYCKEFFFAVGRLGWQLQYVIHSLVASMQGT